nr:GTPase [Wolbachia endosymbiont of Litomosoides sigmodontis]
MQIQKVRNYPFTTTKPHLGVTKADNSEIIIVDTPGIITDTHLGGELVHKF